MENKCEHKKTRKLYFQRQNKWVTTAYSICQECGSVGILNPQLIEILEGNKTRGNEE